MKVVLYPSDDLFIKKNIKNNYKTTFFKNPFPTTTTTKKNGQQQQQQK
jgi:hypothetical protein